MGGRFHIPQECKWQGEMPADDRARIERAVLAAVRRAIGSCPVKADSVVVESGAPQRFEPARYDAASGTYSLPSYDDGGAPVQVPVTNFEFEPEETDEIVSLALSHPKGEVAEDRVVYCRSPFEGKLIAIFPHWEAVKVRSDRYVVSSHLGRAVQWGLLLFGARSFVILEGPFGSKDSRYYVLGTTHALRAGEIFTGAAVEIGGQEVHGLAGKIYWESEIQDPRGRPYVMRALFTVEGKPMWPPSTSLAEEFYSELELVAPNRGLLPPELARPLVFGEIDKLIAAGDTGGAAKKIAELDAAAFALLDWETKVRYLTVLTNAWTFEPEEAAIVEIIKSARSRSELDAMVEMLRRNGIYEQMFDDLDSKLWTLLVQVGERFGDPDLLTFDLLFDIMCEIGLASVSNFVNPAEMEEAAWGLVRFLGGTLEGVWTLISEPDKVARGVAELVKLAWKVQRAQMGDLEAILYIGNLLAQFGIKVGAGIRGAHVLGVTGKVMRRVRWALIWEVASWLVGVGEIKALVSGVRFGEGLAWVARLLRIVRGAGSAEKVEVVISKIEHLARLLSKVSSAGKEQEVLRLMAHLPEADVARLTRLLENADVHAAGSLAELAAKHPELAGAAEHALQRIEVLQVLEKRAGKLSENLIEGFRRLADNAGFSNQELLELAGKIPGEHAELFMRSIRAMPDGALGRGVGGRSLGFFENLAGRPQSMQFLIEAGYDSFAGVYRHSRYDFARFEENLQALKDIRAKFPPDQQAAGYQRFLDRLSNQDAAAARDLRDAVNQRRLAAGIKPLRTMTASELDDIVRQTPDITRIRDIASGLDNSSAGSLFERWSNRYVFHRPVGAERPRLFVSGKDNPGLEMWRDRTSDFYLEADGSVWDTKMYRPGTEIDVVQLDDYRKMEELGYIITSDGTKREVTAIRYLFSERAAAEANMDTLLISGAEIWYIDDAGVLQLLR